jgi:hypothetical protein
LHDTHFSPSSDKPPTGIIPCTWGWLFIKTLIYKYTHSK